MIVEQSVTMPDIFRLDDGFDTYIIQLNDKGVAIIEDEAAAVIFQPFSFDAFKQLLLNNEYYIRLKSIV